MALALGKTLIAAVVAASAAAMLAGCTSNPPPPAPAASISVDELVGKWGLASYHSDADRARTETAARAQCNKPYVINKGPNGGVMMYLADQAEPQELVIKAGQDGKTYIGPPGDAGGQFGREIISANNTEFVTRWMDPDAASRYGTMVYARCSAGKT